MENKMETTIVYWGENMGIMEKKMETTVVFRSYNMDVKTGLQGEFRV